MKPSKALGAALQVLVAGWWTAAQAERISFDTPQAWSTWSIPTGAVTLSDQGLAPVPVRKKVNASLDAASFAGTFLAGSAQAQAALVGDGDPLTGWAPQDSDPLENQWLEVDLGRLVTAEKIRLRFAEGTPPLEFFNVLLSTGEQFFTNALVPIPGTMVFSHSETFGFNKSGLVELSFKHGSVRALRLQAAQRTPGFQLVEVEVEAIGDNVALGMLERGGAIDLITDLQNVLEGGERMVDGDIVTNWALQTFHQTQTGKDVFNRVIFDLGALYWLDQLRVVGEPASAPSGLRSVYGNFFWYQVLASDGSRAPDGTLRWHEVAFLPNLPENQIDTRNFDHAFPLQKVRYIQHYYPSTAEGGERSGTHGLYRNFGLISEYQFYGEGYPAQLRLRSPILDLKGIRNVTAVEWAGHTPESTQIEIFTRTGNEVIEQILYYDKKGKEITQKKWEKTPATQRGPVDTLQAIGSDWSIWSPAYIRSGELFKSPSPRQYLQVEVRLLSDAPQASASLRELHLVYENPIALQTAGEVYPQQVQPGKDEEFTYFIQPTFGGRSQGFNRLSLNASVPVVFTQAKIGGQEVQGRIDTTAEGFALTLPAVVKTEELVQLSFRSTIYQNRTRFDLFLSNTQLGEAVLQRVDEGDASAEVASESISVSLPITGELLANLSLAPAVLTPNGDGIGDQMRLEFDAFKLLSPRPVQVTIYDLAGRVVVRLIREGLAQHHTFNWDGRNAEGRLVSPGTYLIHTEISGDSGTQTVERLLPVAY
ncbi:MAG: hypothetical protein FJY95_16355 [Candidatus Handelsmanbacteria bacterium]|nr:hypothetical protein [Candidatus Handelsmanbacteria bacterium]